ncbi:MAG: hypothetical protein KME40_08450 [Komarekiella atlantica HA4396-MV6]|jgi:pyrimidine deaminase RibD-like protein|nr:hypothetical protein [Komarekiella atlantica HA4396-MV6]
MGEWGTRRINNYCLLTLDPCTDAIRVSTLDPCTDAINRVSTLDPCTDAIRVSTLDSYHLLYET